MTLFKNKSKTIKKSTFNGTLFLSTPVYQNIILSDMQNVQSMTETKICSNLVNNFLVLDESSNFYVQYNSVNSTNMFDLSLNSLTCDSNSKYDGISEINRLLFEMFSELENISMDVMSYNKFKITRLPNIISKNLNEFVEIPGNMWNLKNKKYCQSKMYNENNHYNSKDNIIEYFKNPLMNFDNFISYENDDSFSSFTFSNNCLNKFIIHIRKHLSNIILNLDEIINENIHKIEDARRSDNIKEVIAEEIINKTKNEKYKFTNSNTPTNSYITPEKNNFICKVDLIPLFYENENITDEQKNIFKENLTNILILRILNCMPFFTIIPVNKNLMKNKLSKTNNCSFIFKQSNNFNIDYIDEDGNESIKTENDIPLLLNGNINSDNNDTQISLNIEKDDEIDKHLFEQAKKFIKTVTFDK